MHRFDRPLLVKSLAASLLAHLLIVVLFVEANGGGDEAARGIGAGALTVRLALRGARPEPPDDPVGIAITTRASTDWVRHRPTASAYTEVDSIASPAPTILAAPLSPIPPGATSSALADMAPLPEPPRLPRVAADAIARIEAPTIRRLDRDVPPLPEPSPLPRVAADPPAHVATPALRTFDRDALPLAEPPPLPRVAAEPLARIVTPALRPLDRDAPPLPEPPPLPRVATESLPKAQLPMMRPFDRDASGLAEPPSPGAEPAARAPAAVAEAPAAALPSSQPAGVRETLPSGVDATSPAGPARLDFGPRRAADADLAARVGEPAQGASVPSPDGRLDIGATLARARELNRAPVAPRKGAPLDLSPTRPEPESTLGRAIARSAQPDCRAAYAGLGLLGLPFLLLDTVTDTGCRW